MINPDFFARINLLSAADGGRKGATPKAFFNCSLLFDKSLFDCRIILEKNKKLEPGDKEIVPVKMLNIELAQEKLVEGMEFEIWDGRVVGSGTITMVVR